MYYLIDNDPDLRFTDVEEVLQYCVTSDYYEEDYDGFDEYLNEFGSVDVCGYEFSRSEILKELNGDAYSREMCSWAEARAEDDRESFYYDVNNLEPGSSIWVNDYEVFAYEDEEEDELDDPTNYELLEVKIYKQKQVEEAIHKEQEKTGNDFLSALGIQVI